MYYFNAESQKNVGVKGRSLVPDSVTCYSKDAQRDWIECLRLRSREQKCEFLKGVQTTFLREGR